MSTRWTPDEDTCLLYMRDIDHASMQDISRALGRTRHACKSRHTLLHKQPEPVIRAPADLLADRDARYQLWLQQHPVARMMGDPLPERSALDGYVGQSKQ